MSFCFIISFRWVLRRISSSHATLSLSIKLHGQSGGWSSCVSWTRYNARWADSAAPHHPMLTRSRLLDLQRTAGPSSRHLVLPCMIVATRLSRSASNRGVIVATSALCRGSFVRDLHGAGSGTGSCFITKGPSAFTALSRIDTVFLSSKLQTCLLPIVPVSSCADAAAASCI